MNRLKVWVFTLVTIAVAGFLLRAHSETLRQEAEARIDARLVRGAAQAEVATRNAVREAAALAVVASLDPALARALAARSEPAAAGKPRTPPAAPVDPTAAARDALAGAAMALGLASLPEGALVVAGDRASLERQTAAGPLAEPAALAKAEVGGRGWASLVRTGGKLFAAAAAPVQGEGALAVLLPLGEPFARTLAATTGLDVILAAPEARAIATGAAAEAPALAEVARRAPGATLGIGSLGPVDASVPPIPLKGLPPLFGAPALRIRGLALEGIEGGVLVLAAPLAPALGPVAVFEWRAVAVLGALLLLGLLFGALVRPSEILPTVPEEIVAAAARIERGEFDARAPQLAGKLGTVAAALNRAAAAAAAAAAAGSVRAQDPFAPPPAPAEADPSEFEFPSRPLRLPPAEPAPAPGPIPAASSTSRMDGAGLVGGAFEAAPVPARAEPEAPAPAQTRAPAPAQARAPAPAQARAPAPAAAEPLSDEEGHWRQVFDDFLRMRAECGEPAQGLPYERFRQKLEANKATLVAKYGCRTVRFQVHVKEGKTALKATPVR